MSVERVRAAQTSLYTSPRAFVQLCGFLGVKLLAQGCVHVFLLLVLPAWCQNGASVVTSHQVTGRTMGLSFSSQAHQHSIGPLLNLPGVEKHIALVHTSSINSEGGHPFNVYQPVVSLLISFAHFSHRQLASVLFDSYWFLECVVLILSFIYCRQFPQIYHLSYKYIHVFVYPLTVIEAFWFFTRFLKLTAVL